MTVFDVNAGMVAGILTEVNETTKTYPTDVTKFGTDVQALATACKAEPIGTALQGASEKAFATDINNVVGRSNIAVNAVNNVLGILSDAQTQMSDDARDAKAKAEQATADDAPPPPVPATEPAPAKPGS